MILFIDLLLIFSYKDKKDPILENVSRIMISPCSWLMEFGLKARSTGF